MKKVINTAARSVTFTFDGLESITMHAEAMSAANYDYAALHGLIRRGLRITALAARQVPEHTDAQPTARPQPERAPQPAPAKPAPPRQTGERRRSSYWR